MELPNEFYAPIGKPNFMKKTYETARASFKEVADLLRDRPIFPKETDVPGVYELSEESRRIIEKAQIKRDR